MFVLLDADRSLALSRDEVLALQGVERVQGLAANIRRFQNSSVSVHTMVRSPCLPKSLSAHRNS